MEIPPTMFFGISRRFSPKYLVTMFAPKLKTCEAGMSISIQEFEDDNLPKTDYDHPRMRIRIDEAGHH